MDTARSVTCCITGQTNILPEAEEGILASFHDIVSQLIDKGIINFYVGGALGFDMLVTESILKLQQKEKGITIRAVIPHPNWDANWPEDKKKRQQAILEKCISIEYARPKFCKGLHLIRDKMLVNNSLHCITYCNRAIGGTAETLRYALGQGLQIYNTCHWDLNQLISKERSSVVVL